MTKHRRERREEGKDETGFEAEGQKKWSLDIKEIRWQTQLIGRQDVEKGKEEYNLISHHYHYWQIIGHALWDS